jgi:signal transduction histidine kinase/CheY-like chemotaxis protein
VAGPRADLGSPPALQAVLPEPSLTAAWSAWSGPGRYAIELLGIGLAYFVFAKIGLALASINPSATPIWPPTGLALAAVMLWGYRVCPAIFAAAWLANATTAGSIYTSSAIALGNTLESVVGAYLISRWSGGLRTFDTPGGVARFALICLAAAAPLSATIGVGSLSLAGYAGDDLASTWITWWLGDLAGALVITPVLVLWILSRPWTSPGEGRLETWLILAAAMAVGVIAFSPLIEQTVHRDPLGFLAIVPLMWAALRRGQRDTATVALLLSCFAVWGTMADGGPFARGTLNDSLLLLLMFMISTSVPTLALSADVAARKATERRLRAAHEELDQIVHDRTAALEETRQALHQAQKMEALGRLTGGIAHDFNNILTVVTNSLETVRASLTGDAKNRTRLDRALQAARNGGALIHQMLVFARRHPLQLEPMDVNEVIKSTLKMLSRSRPEGVDVRADLAADLRPATADATQLQAAILNLAVNACDAMPAGGTLTVRTANFPPGAELPANLPPLDYVCVAVSDTGIGMTPEVLARAFEPFFTTKDIGKGTGLGLSMVYSAMQQMGGAVAIESNPGSGTTVRLILPATSRAPAADAVEAEAQSAASHAPPEPGAVLYVEDDALVSVATVDVLESAGYAIYAAPDARRALALLDTHPELELMVTDIGLPGMNGHDLAAEARRRRPHLKVLFLTGHARTRAVGEAADQRTKYLDKPYLDSDLFEALRQLASESGTDAGAPA